MARNLWKTTKEAIQNTYGTIDKVISNTWAIELAAMVAAMATFTALLLHLCYWDQKPVDMWKELGNEKVNFLFETLEASVSFLVTVLRALMLLNVASAISQLRWYYIKHQGKRVEFLQALDYASRGVLGSITLLISRNFLNWSSLGCVVTVAAFLLGTLTQNSVKQATGAPQIRVKNATMTVAEEYSSSFANGNNYTAGVNIEAGIVAGWIHSTSGHHKENLTMEELYPTPVDCPDKAWCEWKNISTLAITCECAVKPASLFGLEEKVRLIMMAQEACFNKTSLCNKRPGLISHIVATARYNNGTIEHAECALYWALAHISKAVYREGKLQNYNWTIQREVSPVPATGEDKDGWLLGSFRITADGGKALSKSMESCFTRHIKEKAEKAGDEWWSYDEMTTRMFLQLWNQWLSTESQPLSRTLRHIVHNVALYTSAAIRADSKTTLRGDATTESTVYEIQMRYLIYPGVVLALSIIFFLMTVYMTWNDELWKSSLLPLLYHGFAKPVSHDFRTTFEMKIQSEGEKFRLRGGQEGLRLHPREKETNLLYDEEVRTCVDDRPSTEIGSDIVERGDALQSFEIGQQSIYH